MKKLFKNIIFFALGLFSPRLQNRASILMYHSFGDNGQFFTVSKKDFEKQLEYLKRKNLNVVKLSELLEKMREGEDISNIVCLTVDDGYKDNYEIAFPLLKKYNFPATIFLATGFVGGKITTSENFSSQILAVQEILEMQKSGLVEFMPHGTNHKKLTELPHNEAVLEISGSRSKISEITGKNIEDSSIFAYPKGRYNGEIADYLKKEGWMGAVSVKRGTIAIGDDRYTLKRNSVDSKTSFVQFKGLVSGAIDKFIHIINV